LGRWTAPSWEENGFLALGRLHCRYECAIKIKLDELAFDSPSLKIAHRNSLNGVVSLTNPPARLNSPASDRKGSSTRPRTDFGIGLPPEKWSSLMYGLWPDGGLKNAKEETHG
jgi:hypothetical protein